jgi:hypothetical protein
MGLVYVSIGILIGLLFICLGGIFGVIKKSPYDSPYNVILPVGFVSAFVFAAIGFHTLFHQIGQ